MSSETLNHTEMFLKDTRNRRGGQTSKKRLNLRDVIRRNEQIQKRNVQNTQTQ